MPHQIYKNKEGKRLSLNNEEFALIDEDDYKLVSEFKWFVDIKGKQKYAKCKKYIGRVSGKYIYKRLYLHRLIMNPPKGMDVDHINGNGLDNRRCNLRICTRSQNIRNAIGKKGTSQYKGVCRHRNSWLASITKDYKQIHIGHYSTEIEAAKAYDKKAKELFGEFAKFNIGENNEIVSRTY